MSTHLPRSICAALFAISLSACASTARESPDAGADPAGTTGKCDAHSLSWTIGQVADDALVERARTEAGAQVVRVLRPGMMVTNDFSAARLNLRVDNERKVLAYSCG